MTNRRFFHRVDVRANGEFVWATKSRLGKVTTNREYITTRDISVDGARIVLPGRHHFPERCRARVKFGLEFCDVEVLDSADHGDDTILRILFLNPTSRFVAVIEKYLPVATDDREAHQGAWT